MRISEDSILNLQTILKKQIGEEYDSENVQAAGRAILKLCGIKLYQQFEKDNEYEIQD